MQNSNNAAITSQPTNARPQGGQGQYPMGQPMMGPGQQYQMGPPGPMMGQGQQYQMGGMPMMGPMPMPMIQPIPGVPPGLEYLTVIDFLIVKQQVEMLEAISGLHTPNKYDILNAHGELVFRAAELMSDSAYFYGSRRDFNITLFDMLGRQIMHLYRPAACCGQEKLTVSAPPGNLIGSVDPQSCCDPDFIVTNAAGLNILKIGGLGCGCCNFGTVDFPVRSLQGTEVGKITKQWAGYVQESFTAADNFGISFPRDLDASVKATLLGACILIDFSYFENAQNAHNTNRHGHRHRGGYGYGY